MDGGDGDGDLGREYTLAPPVLEIKSTSTSRRAECKQVEPGTNKGRGTAEPPF
jgi:hypothetical protein